MLMVTKAVWRKIGEPGDVEGVDGFRFKNYGSAPADAMTPRAKPSTIAGLSVVWLSYVSTCSTSHILLDSVQVSFVFTGCPMFALRVWGTVAPVSAILSHLWKFWGFEHLPSLKHSSGCEPPAPRTLKEASLVWKSAQVCAYILFQLCFGVLSDYRCYRFWSVLGLWLQNLPNNPECQHRQHILDFTLASVVLPVAPLPPLICLGFQCNFL